MNAFDVDVRLSRGAFELEATFRSPAGITVLAGANGSGKTSLLMAVLGALRPRGRVEVAGRVVFDSDTAVDLPVHVRRLGVVYQEGLLFPHLDVRHNVLFGLSARARGLGRATRLARADEWLERVGATAFADRRPDALSAGQRQRVVLARALASDPAALLLDEPFSAIDGAGRRSLVDLLVELHRTSHLPFLHVTHDLGEALRLGDRVVLMEQGRVVQSGPPATVFAAPASIGAARAVGTENRFRATVREQRQSDGLTVVELGPTPAFTTWIDEPIGTSVTLGLRAQDVLLSLEPLTRTSARNVIAGRIEHVEARGPAVELRVATPTPFRVIVTPDAVRELGLDAGREVWMLIKASAFHRLV